MSETIQFIVMAFATWRIAHMFWADRGPFDVFLKFRGLFIMETKFGTRTRGIGQMLLCMWCLTVWAAMPFALYIAGNVLEFVMYTTALSGAAVLLHSLQGRLEG